MNNPVISCSLFRVCALTTLFLFVFLHGSEGNAQESKKNSSLGIQITLVPKCGAGPDRMDRIAGVVRHPSSDNLKVVIFSHTNKWWVQPYVANPFTDIMADGRWMSQIHLGYEYAAFLVQASYRPPATTAALPEVGGEILAISHALCKD